LFSRDIVDYYTPAYFHFSHYFTPCRHRYFLLRH
jgi:hypothetical protein